jgi:hypothetical protein
MTQQESRWLDAAINNLANATDTLTGTDRVRVGQIMQELSDMTGSQVDIEECLAEAAANV